MNTVTILESEIASDSPEFIDTSVPHARPRRPRVWTAFTTLLCALIAGQVLSIAGFVAVGIGTGFVTAARGANIAAIEKSIQELAQQPLPALLLSLIPFQIGMAMVVWFAASRSKQSLKERLGLLPQSGRVLSKFKLASMAGFTISTALSLAIGYTLLVGQPAQDNAISAAIADGSWWTITLLSIILSVIPALVEETLFRGYLQRRFLERWSPAVAIGFSTVLFALMHMDSLQHIVAVVPLGIVTGLLAYRTNSVKPGMLVHGLHNVGAVGFGALASALSPYIGLDGVGLLMLGAIVVLGLVGLPAIVSLLRSVKPQAAVEAVIAAPESPAETVSVLIRDVSIATPITDSQLAA